MLEILMPTLGPEFLAELQSVLVPLALRVFAGGAVGLVLAVIVSIWYRRRSSHPRGLVIGSAIGIFIVCGAVLPLSLGLEGALERTTDSAIAHFSPELERAVAEAGLDPNAIELEHLRRAADELAAAYEAAADDPESADLPDLDPEQVRAMVDLVHARLGDAETVSVRQILHTTRDLIVADFYRFLPLASALVAAVPILFVGIMLVTTRSTGSRAPRDRVSEE